VVRVRVGDGRREDTLRKGGLLSPEEIGRAIQFGEKCTAPIVRIPGKRGQDFDVYVESPLGRAALAIATAHVMRVSTDAQAVRRAMRVSHYRVWGDRPIGSRATVTVQEILIRPQAGRDITSLAQQYERFFVGTVPSHGIIEPLRLRFGEAV